LRRSDRFQLGLQLNAMLIQVGLDALFEILEGFIHAGVAGFSFVDGSASKHLDFGMASLVD
jgi:hypothetical protein